MNINDFTLPEPSEAATLSRVDELVSLGVSRERAERIIARLEATINGAWKDLLESLRQPENGPYDPELGFIQTAFIAYIDQWAEARRDIAYVTQTLTLRQFIVLDAASKDTM